MHTTEKPPIDILLVEDNEGDVELTRIAFEMTGVSVKLHVASDGAQALKYLRRSGEYAHVPAPSLILLDINMPRMDGMEFLGIVKSDETLKLIPIIMLTSSNARTDIIESYRRHANSYILKPRSNEEGVEMAKQVESFWLNLAQLPHTSAA